MATFRMHELNAADACSTRRNFSYVLQEKTKEHMAKSAAIKQTLRDLFEENIAEVDVLSSLEERFAEIPYPSEQQRKIHAMDAYRQIMRYYKSETRIPIMVGAKTIDVGQGMTVLTTPDYVFAHDDVLEVVKIKASKPNITQANAYEDIGLYAMVKYGEKMVNRGATCMVRASYYFLAKKNDSHSVDKPNFDPDFFNTVGGLNIVTIGEAYDSTSKSPTVLDEAYEPIVKAFLEGIPESECTKTDCERCELFDICKYQEPPVAITKAPVVRSVKDIVLTSSQEEAIEYEEGVCRINAGAGAGKTLVIALRVATLLSKGVKPEQICLVTFTKAGAEEMLTRIKMYVEDLGLDVNLNKMTIQTFNAFGDEIIRKDYKKVGFTEPPTVIDDVERSHIIATIINEAVKEPMYTTLSGETMRNPIARLDFRNFAAASKYARGAVPTVKKVFDSMKQNQYTANDAILIRKDLGRSLRGVNEFTIEALARLYDKYGETLRENNLIEFADQQVLVFELLHGDPYYFEQFKFAHIIVDEFQDSDAKQIEMLKLLRECPTFKSLMVVGDDSQAIFGFRDTTPEFIIHFDKHMGEEIDDIYLIENHRSTPEIIEYANTINSNNVYRVHKNLISTRPHGKPVVVKGFHSSKDERDFVIQGIEEHLASGCKPEDVAIICYTKYELMEMASLLREKNIPSVMLNPEPLIENGRVRAAIALINAIQDVEDTKDRAVFANALNPGHMMSMTEEEIQAEIEKVSQVIEEYVAIEDETEKKVKLMEMLTSIDRNEDEVYESFLETLDRKKTVYQIYEYTREFYLYGSSAAFKRNHDYPGVVLTTAHSSKGLEWNVVYDMISKYDDEDTKSLESVEERRRLLFVSATRARDELYVTGQYIAYGKKGNYTYNKYLIESYRAVGKEFSITSIEAEKAILDEQKKQSEKQSGMRSQ